MVLHDDTHHENPELEEHHYFNWMDNQICFREQNRDNLLHEESQEEDTEIDFVCPEQTENERHELDEDIRLGRHWEYIRNGD